MFRNAMGWTYTIRISATKVHAQKLSALPGSGVGAFSRKKALRNTQIAQSEIGKAHGEMISSNSIL